MKQKLAHIFFWLGDKWSKLDRFDWFVKTGIYYSAYDFFMTKSFQFDVNEKIWTEIEPI